MVNPEHPAVSLAQRPEELELTGLEARVDAALRVELDHQEPPEGHGDGLEGEVFGM